MGANANIAKAFEINQKDYVWVLGDSYVYDWTNWSEVEEAVNNNEKIIVATRDTISDDNKTTAAVLAESGFLSTCIFSKETLEGIVVKLMYDNIYTMFPHVVPLVNFVNTGKEPYILKKGIVSHGYWVGQEPKGKAAGWYRDFKEAELYSKNATMSYITGMSIILSNIKDIKLKSDAFEALFRTLQGLSGGRNPFVEQIDRYLMKKDISQLCELYTSLDKEYCKGLEAKIISIFPLKSIICSIYFKIYGANLSLKRNICCFAKYFLYSAAQNITFGKTKEKMQQKKDKYKERISNF